MVPCHLTFREKQLPVWHSVDKVAAALAAHAGEYTRPECSCSQAGLSSRGLPGRALTRDWTLLDTSRPSGVMF